jgi:very-short-patch-repair endonuclease
MLASGNETPAAGNGAPAPVAPGSLATAQNGLVTRAQLTETGLSPAAIGRRATNGTLHRFHRGVYLVGHEALAPLARETAALLACGEGAALSHISAAAVWSIVPGALAAGDVQVTAVGRKLRSRPGLRIHRAAQLEVRHRHGIRLTSPAQTLLDLAADRSNQLEQAFVEAHGQRLLRAGELSAFTRRAEGRAGVPALRGLIEAYATGYTRSRAEQAMRQLARRAGFPQPSVNTHLHGYLVDFLWADERLIVEVDSFGFHGHRRAFETDRKRDATLVAAGYRVIRVTWRQLTQEPFSVVAVLARALAA